MSDRLLTVPNAVTLARLLLLAPVCWLILTRHAGWTTLLILILWAATDWIDGFLARRLNQVSRWGQILDPIADRTGIAAVVACLAWVEALSWFAVAMIVVVDLCALVLAGPAARRGQISVTWLGKIRTAVMFVGIVALVAQHSGVLHLGILAQVLIGVGLVLHVVVGIRYIQAATHVSATSASGVAS